MDAYDLTKAVRAIQNFASRSFQFGARGNGFGRLSLAMIKRMRITLSDRFDTAHD